ncbi:MAG: hypothetical protein IJ682_01825 [Lachnospiraceae bacterium]|nr:hypothetical protein [Lachnospiraceae bacterium]
MFSTKLVENRLFVPCIVVTDVPMIHTFIMDTGAKYTCCSYKNINPVLTEAECSGLPTKVIGGFVGNAGVKFYHYPVKQFIIGNIDLKSRKVWITFNQLATDDVLGVDLLQDVSFLYKRKSREIVFFDDNTVKIG